MYIHCCMLLFKSIIFLVHLCPNSFFYNHCSPKISLYLTFTFLLYCFLYFFQHLFSSLGLCCEHSLHFVYSLLSLPFTNLAQGSAVFACLLYLSELEISCSYVNFSIRICCLFLFQLVSCVPWLNHNTTLRNFLPLCGTIFPHFCLELLVTSAHFNIKFYDE